MAKVFLSGLQDYVRELLARIAALSTPSRHTAFVIGLSGAVGAGKTTFMQSFAKELGVEESVLSPTYVLMKEYPIAWNGFTRLVHIDAYRLEGVGEFTTLKPERFLRDPKALVCIEWPENIDPPVRLDLVLRFSACAETDARTIDSSEVGKV